MILRIVDFDQPNPNFINMNTKVAVLVLLACIACTNAMPKKYGKDDSYEKDTAKYQFAYQVKAGGKAYGSDSGEKYSKGNSAEFGHAESRDNAKTSGKYFVELPDGRTQTVEYSVNGDSGYIAKVSYSGGSGEKPAYAKQ